MMPPPPPVSTEPSPFSPCPRCPSPAKSIGGTARILSAVELARNVLVSCAAESTEWKQIRNLADAATVRHIQENVSPPKRRRGRLLTIAIGAAIAVQVPMVLAVGRLGHHPGAALAGAGVLNVPFMLGMRNPWRDWGRSRLWLYLGMWPFFAWAAVCIAFALVVPAGLLA